MLAVVARGNGHKRVLVLEESLDPQRGSDEVLVTVKAASLNNGDVRNAFNSPEGYRPGWDFAGIVEEAPAGSGLIAGQRVFGLVAGGAWAERIAVPVSFVAPIPDGLSFTAAAALPIAGMTAAACLAKKSPSSGQRVLVTAATGGVGVMAVQLAASTGAHVTALAREATAEGLLRRLGADDVVIGSALPLNEARYDLILEGVGGSLLGQVLERLAPRGMCVNFGDAAGDEPTKLDARRFRLGDGGTFGGTTLYGFFLLEELTRPDPIDAHALLRDLAARAESGKLDPVVGKSAPWESADNVSRALLSRGFGGKAVLEFA